MGSPSPISQATLIRTVPAVPSGSLPHRASADGVPATPGRGTLGYATAVISTPTAAGSEPVTPGRSSASGSLVLAAQAQARPRSPEAFALRRQGGAQSATLLAPHAMAVAASTPVLRSSLGGGAKDALRATSPSRSPTGASVSKTSLLAGSSLGQLLSKVGSSVKEREEEMRRQRAEQKETEELLSRSREELAQLISVVSQLHELQQSASDVLPNVLQLGPERPRASGAPPFCWAPSQEYANEFEISGDFREVVTKVNDFEDQGWVIPVGGSLRLMKGGVYRWTMCIERKCPSRPQLQIGIHGMNHSQPWRLVTTSRCSWSRDDEPWQDRPGGDKLIDEGHYVHIEVDLRGVASKHGTFSLAVNDEPFETFFDDIPLTSPYPLIPVVSMGGAQSRVRLCPGY